LKFFQEFIEGKKRAKKAQESGVTAEMGEITIVSWEEWIRDIVWEDVDQKQAEKENEENGEGSNKELDESKSNINGCFHSFALLLSTHPHVMTLSLRDLFPFL